MSNNYIVYKHTSPNGKVYIGITRQNPKIRWRNDGSGYQHNIYFTNAIQKYGWDNFQHEILCTGLTKEEAEQKEIELIAYYKSNQRKFGYNIANGGNCIGTVSEETKAKIAYANECRSQETRSKLRQAVLGKKLSTEIKTKMSNAHKGRFLSEETRRKIGESNSGLKRTEDVKRRISETKTGTHLSEETKRKISESIKGKGNKRVRQYNKNGEFIAEYNSLSEAYEKTYVNVSHISSCCRGNRKTAGGYIWKYATNV